MLVFSGTWFFSVKASGRRKPGAVFRHGVAAMTGAPAARRPSQLFPGKAALTHFSGSGRLLLPHLTTTTIQLLCSRSREGRSPGATALLGWGWGLLCWAAFSTVKRERALLEQGREQRLLFTGGSRGMAHSQSPAWIPPPPKVLRQD